MTIAANKTWEEEVLTPADLNDEFTHYRNLIKNNKDMIIGDEAEGTGYAGHDHEGENGVQLGTDALEDLAVSGDKIANSTITSGKLSAELNQFMYMREQRAPFTWSSVTAILIGGARYLHLGTTDQIVYWSEELTLNFTGLGNSDWYYIYLDDSAIVAADTNELTADEIIYSTTEPAWSDEKLGWYNGSDRCIFAVLTNGSGEILAFYHDGDSVLYDLYIADLDQVDISSIAWTTVTITIPSFCRKAEVTFRYDNSNGTIEIMQWRTKGSASVGHRAIGVSTTDDVVHNTCTIIVNSDLQIEVMDSDVTNNKAYCFTDGWFFPIGM